MNYTADMLCMIAQPNYEKDIPLYTELINGEKPKRKLSAEEIKENVLQKLGA